MDRHKPQPTVDEMHRQAVVRYLRAIADPRPRYDGAENEPLWNPPPGAWITDEPGPCHTWD